MRIDSNYINNPNYFDVLIVGAGPAGLTAALYCKRANLKVAFYEKETPGGKVVKTGVVENYPGFESISGPDLAVEMFKQVSKLGVKFIFSEVVKISKIDNIFHVHSKDNQIRFAKTVIIASGMSEKKLNVPGEKEYYGKGVSYCAICDAALYKGKKVVVIGGGNTALEESLYLADIVDEVLLIHRRDEFRGEEFLVDKVQKHSKIKMFLSYVPEEFISNDSKKINAIKIKNLKNNESEILETSCIFPFIGFVPITNFVDELDVVNPKTGFIDVNSKMQTKVDGLFCVGDVVNKEVRQISTAIGDGTVAAIEAKKYIDFFKF